MEVDSGIRPAVSSAEAARFKGLERENSEGRRANGIFRTAAAFFASGGARPQTLVMVKFIDGERGAYGVSPFWEILSIALSTYHGRKPLQVHRDQRRACAQRAETLRPEIVRVFSGRQPVYDAHKARNGNHKNCGDGVCQWSRDDCEF